MAHLSHKIPWNHLVKCVWNTDNDGHRKWSSYHDDKGVEHFARVMAKTLMEFGHTAQTISDTNLDLDTWPAYGEHAMSSSGGGHLPVLYSVISVYIRLNLLLLNDVFLPGADSSHAFACCAGFFDGGHKPWIADQFREICVTDADHFIKLQPINMEILQKINIISKIYFEALYRYFRKHQTTIDDIASHIIAEIVPIRQLMGSTGTR